MDNLECSICNNKFDDNDHRPRSLPCGHGFCTQCIEACIGRINKCCPICKSEYNANTATDLPVCYLLEELIIKAASSTAKKRMSDAVIEMVNRGMCHKHKGIVLYFLCETHNIKVCHNCAVKDHPPASCNLISLGDEINKKSQTVTVQIQTQAIIDTKNDLKWLLKQNIDELTEQKNAKQNLEKELKMLPIKIEQINQDILKNEKSKEQINDEIQGCTNKQKSFEFLENKLRVATNQEISKECEIATKEILQNQAWNETLRNELNMGELNQMYVRVEKNGIIRCSKAHKYREKMFIPSLSKNVKCPRTPNLIQNAELGLTNATVTVWMDLSSNGHTLGRVTIRVMNNTGQGQQFTMLALGTNGPTLKGAKFFEKDNDSMWMYGYVNENEIKTSENLLAQHLFITAYEEQKRGRLYAGNELNHTNFEIITQSNPNLERCGYFGDVITGMPVIVRAKSDEFNIKSIIISNCGIVIDYKHRSTEATAI